MNRITLIKSLYSIVSRFNIKPDYKKTDIYKYELNDICILKTHFQHLSVIAPKELNVLIFTQKYILLF